MGRLLGTLLNVTFLFNIIYCCNHVAVNCQAVQLCRSFTFPVETIHRFLIYTGKCATCVKRSFNAW